MADIEQLKRALVNADAAGDTAAATELANEIKRISSGAPQPQFPIAIGKEAFPGALKEVLSNTDWGTRNIAGAGTALSDVYYGGKQLLGNIYDRIRSPSPTELITGKRPTWNEADAIANNRIISESAPVGAVAGNVALAAIPFAKAGSSVAKAGLIGGGLGALSPVSATNVEDIGSGKLLNTGIGAAAGAAGQKIANKVNDWMTQKAASLAARKATNQPIDDTIKEALAAGYKIPPGQVAPTARNKALESITGKISTQQQFAAHNQDVTNDLARQAAGLPNNAPITQETLKAARDAIKKPYQEIASLGLQSKLDALDAARAEANAAWREYSRQGTRSALKDFQNFKMKAANIEARIESALTKAARPDLMESFRKARVALAQNHDVESALIEGGGTIDARIIARMTQRGDKLSGPLKTIGNFANNFRRDVQPGAQTGTPDAHNLKAILSMLAAGGGGAALGPAGVLLGLAPLGAAPIARKIMMSNPVQRGLIRQYTVPASQRAAAGLLRQAPAIATTLSTKR
jgi:hypothetical protein